jgi:hypothetical protein
VKRQLRALWKNLIRREQVDPSLSGYADDRTRAFDMKLAATLEAIPGVESAGLSSVPILQGSARQNPVVAEGSAMKPVEDQPLLDQASPNLSATLGLPILEGRDFTLQDSGKNGHAIINETFAREYFPGAIQLASISDLPSFGICGRRCSLRPTCRTSKDRIFAASPFMCARGSIRGS